MSIFSEYKSTFLSFIEDRDYSDLKFPLAKIGRVLNNYVMGDFIVVGGRKTSGKSSFMLYNYVTSPLLQHLNEESDPSSLIHTRVVYINTRSSKKSVMEKMAVNFLSARAGGNRLSVPSLYGMHGPHLKLDIDNSKLLVSNAFNSFNKLIHEGILSVFTGRRSLASIENILDRVMEEFGTIVDSTFTFTPGNEDAKILIVIDDASGIYDDNGLTGKQIAAKLSSILRTFAKTYGVLIVLGVPSAIARSQIGVHIPTSDEISPYMTYADRSIILHNPVETGDYKSLGYVMEDFRNDYSGVTYFRFAYIANNSMGPTGSFIPLFLYPENGVFLEVPSADDEVEVDEFIEARNIRFEETINN